MGSVLNMKQPDEMTPTEVLAVGRLGEAMHCMETAQKQLNTHRDQRDEQIVALRLEGWTVADCATIAGLSVGQINNVCTAKGVTATRGAKRSARRK